MAIGKTLETGALRYRKKNMCEPRSNYHDWVRDDRLEVWLNHESRSHMPSDLGRYFYTAAFGRAFGRTPKGHLDFALKGLAPDHANWESGKFIDRFRVQRWGSPSTTVTSHIAKDGHYFIHPDPGQCRSLTVREAARLQAFPDNYFFQGNRTQQYHQVGNAVPSLLARQIAGVVHAILTNQTGSE
jgi:DNA (cytosine-5)-methyltransferase 1